ncbi:adhesion G-protein coupled receptor G6-like [Dendronephthya gigantea]|uniref:adhesion G-protein coupled receptor G6-like n=1 Tax=Dendronephthya gigantea TaxID=151771 RepID=UPI00106CFE00|nr:adhesion G-protein coupled receptor G6-like [Dendronephthya gigantea]
MANPNEPDLNITRENIAFLQLLNSTGNFTVAYDGYNVSIINLILKQLSCYGEEKSHEHDIDRENGTFLVNKTGERLLLDDYTIVKEEGGNVTLCRKLVLSDCLGGSYVPLAPNEYRTFPNLSVYYKATNRTFHFGDYLIRENSNVTSEDSGNSTIAICLPFKTTFNETEVKYKTNRTSYALQILTTSGFSVSITCLFLLLLTYGLFKELRTVPGLNLMNLSFSMFLSQLVWLVGTSHFTGTTTCKAFAIVGHYLLQTSFLAMSVISHHTCLTLSNPFIGRIVNKSFRRFIAYSAFVWLIPAIVIAICVILDETEVFLIDYGTNCWMETANAKLYLFLLPLAILLLYNIFRFIQTARGLSRHNKDRKMLQQKEGKQNLLICAKIATLVGFPWLFAFFGVLFPDVEAFEYLFVIFVCSQGLYIGVAFLCNKKTLKLYVDRWNAFLTSRENSSSQATGALTFEMT